MPDETTAALREMAAHRGLKLVASRRRKPGGDFGKYALTDATGAKTFGFDGDALNATAEEIEAHLRGAASSAWGASAGSVKANSKPRATPAPKPARKPKPAAPPKPKPLYKPEIANLLTNLPAAKRAEAFTELLARPGLRIERIVSRGQATPEDAPMIQAHDEWVLLLEGAAGIRIEDSAVVTLGPGDHLLIAAGQKHWVAWTAKDRATLWLAVHHG